MDALPKEYGRLSAAELAERIAARKAELGSRLCILGHHYQRDEVIRFADFTGDSLRLSRQAAAQREAVAIVFCGVHFMAESAEILSGAGQIVCLPNPQAGCAMAEMADEDAVATALEELEALAGAPVLPVTYVNSSAAVKALTGRAGGACCTSSNVRNVFEWALRDTGAKTILAIPDQHLGRNTAWAMGLRKKSDCALYDPALPNGGLTAGQAQAATCILWKGHCHVHQVFRPRHVQMIRREFPKMKVIVHPECPREIVALADASGSTEQIIRAIADAPVGSQWAVGTEGNLVRRLARRHPDKTVRTLSPTPAACWQMAMIDLSHLLWTLDGIAEGHPVNRVSVAPAIAADANTALQRMIDIKAATDVSKRA
jgi:quinolinate synthase